MVYYLQRRSAQRLLQKGAVPPHLRMEESTMDMYQNIDQLARSLHQESVDIRRTMHMYPETGWFEMRTSAIIAKRLTELGYEVLTGRQVCREDTRMGVPSPEELEAHYQQLPEQGTPMEYVTEDMREGFTGVIGILRCGDGPVAALRFDIDALPMTENATQDHRPFREGFACGAVDKERWAT